MVNREKSAGASVSYSPSAAAIFIGWTSVMIFPWTSPLMATPSPATRTTAALVRTATVHATVLVGARPRASCQNETPMTNAAPVM